MATNIITAQIKGRSAIADQHAYQYDYGMILKISGVDLPTAYQVDFSNEPIRGTAYQQIGNADGVAIPDACFESGDDIFAWVYLHSGEDDGETVYQIMIPVYKRSKTSGETPTPAQQSAIDEAIAALNDAVESADASAETATEAAAAAAESAAQAATSAEGVEHYAQEAAASAEEAAGYVVTVSEYASQAAASATAAASSATSADQSADEADTSADAAAISATNAAASATAASGSATTATQKATEAANSATAASGSASAAATSAENAAGSAAQAATSATAAASSATTATTNASEASSSASAAAASAESVAASAAQIETNKEDIVDLKSALSDTQDWLGYPKNLFDARVLTVSNTNNWSIDSATKTSVTITHKNTFSTGQPIATLDLPSGDYIFHADYTNSATAFSLRTDGSWVKTLTDGAVFTIDSTKINEIYFSNSTMGTYIITDISAVAKEESSGKIPSLEDATSNNTAKIAALEEGFNSIAQPAIEELTGEETLNKAINPSGTLITAGSDYYRVIKYPVTVGKKYWVTACANWGNVPWCIYDSSDTPLLTGTPSERQSDFTIIDNEEVTAPLNSAYVIIAYQMTAKQGVLKTQTGYKTAKWVGKKWACVGDSLTAENIRTTKHYFDYVADETGITTLNMGVSGSGYARMADSNQAFYQRISSCPTDADVVTIFGSFNDLGAGLSIGSVDDTGTTTLAGCINTTIDNLQAVIPLVNLGIVAPTPWDTTQPTTSGQDYNYVEMLKAICERRSIPFLDLWRCSNLRPWDADFRAIAYSKDGGSGTHPDENGHKLIAPRFKGFLDTLLV